MDPIEQRRAEEKERRREAIVDAAEAVFGDQGFERATMEQVARKARVSRALVYLYFKDKLELHFAICMRALQLLHVRFERLLTMHERGIDQVCALGRDYMRFATEYPTYFDALSRFESHRADVLNDDGSIEQQCVAQGLAVHGVTIRALENGQRDGSVRQDLGNPMLTAMTLWGFTHGCIQIAMTKEAALAAAGAGADAMTEYAIDMARRGVAAPGGG